MENNFKIGDCVRILNLAHDKCGFVVGHDIDEINSDHKPMVKVKDFTGVDYRKYLYNVEKLSKEEATLEMLKFYA